LFLLTQTDKPSFVGRNNPHGTEIANRRSARQQTFRCLGLFGIGIALSLVSLDGDTSSVPRTRVASPASISRPSAGVHFSRATTLAEAKGEFAASAEPESEGPPTRSSFMAHWPAIAGAAGYRLDVSTTPSFQTYVNNYRDLDVGNASARAITGLERGTQYYYRVRPYDAMGVRSNSTTMAAATAPGGGLVISATFDSSITRSANAVAIEGAINRAIAI
jgi:hypothetical protein